MLFISYNILFCKNRFLGLYNILCYMYIMRRILNDNAYTFAILHFLQCYIVYFI